MGDRYRVLVEELTYPTDPAVLARLKAGENLPWRERNVKERHEGDIVDDIPEASVPGLLKAKWIERVVTETAAPARSQSTRGGDGT